MSDLPTPTSVCQATCQAPTAAGQYLCKTHLHELETALRGVPSLAEDLEVSITRQNRTGGQKHGSRSAERPLVWNEHASAAQVELNAIINAWSYETSASIGEDERDPLKPIHSSETADLARWLCRNLLRARQLDNAGDMHAEILDAVTVATRAVDLPPEKKFLGVCKKRPEENGLPCREDLYAMPKQRWATCKACGATHNAQERRDEMLSVVEDQAATTGVLAGLITGLGVPIGSSTIRKYAADGRLKVISKDRNGRSQYLVADVLDVFLKREKRADEQPAA